MSDVREFPATVVDAILKFGDRYERTARLYPALLVLAPLVVTVISLYGQVLGILGTVATSLVACGGLVLLADFARNRGKEREKHLWDKWGGAPSTQLLRHTNNAVDIVSKERYHHFLSRKIGKVFPSADEEKNDPAAADAIYASASNWLRQATRDEKTYRLLMNDNISYGFRRNSFAMRRLGVTVCVAVGAWVLLRHGASELVVHMHTAKNAENLFSAGESTSLAVAFLLLLAWIGFFNEAAVRGAAFSYADKLMLACESLLASESKGRKPRSTLKPACT
ncbi:hypothetical protein C7401_11997 [Paraburkholderia unamae]|uniref:hypothetical protein n=1 Tax=Paraburkholderia unamae TaxID=219649 RepID=UPI000DC4E212|nr:hypothetical protein [Paraburkholderia unamae]RAR56448.1 hypothetical protein C7401_11997 [Paraburkholderia unamae]